MTITVLKRWLGHANAGAMHLGAAAFALGMGLLLVLIGFAKPSGAAVDGRVMRIAEAASGGFSDEALHAATSQMDPAMLALARRYDPNLRLGAASILLSTRTDPFGQAFDDVTPAEAAEINAELPFSTAPNPAARAFSLTVAAALDRQRALDCLTQAIYYEAGFEPTEGLQAVAQVVLNRVRHPAFPKSVCGVVYQGSDRVTGCQFSFTCDGALSRPPAAWAWERSRKVAEAALNGFVMKAVGGATHYHTDYVAPYWAPRLYKVKQIGAHIFYRWPGDWGLPGAFNGKYAGVERPGIDLGGDPNKIDLDSLRLAGLEGVADAAAAAPTAVAALNLVAPTIAEKPAPVAEPVLQSHAPPGESVKPAIVELPAIRPKTPPRLAMPG